MNDLSLARALHAQLAVLGADRGSDEIGTTVGLDRARQLIRQQLGKPAARGDDRDVWLELDDILAGWSGAHIPPRDRNRSAIERIHDAVIKRRFGVAFQPVVELDSGNTAGLEALSRFGDADTQAWFAAASRLGLRALLELSAIEKALDADALATAPAGTFLSINVSPATVLSSLLTEVLDECDLRTIVLELTEDIAVDDPDAVRNALRPLRVRGLRLAIDDTGAGYASLKLILQLRPDFIKFDRFFVTDIERDPARRALFAASVEFARAAGSRVVAEGIETSEQFGILRSLGVDLGQGFYLGEPRAVPTHWAAE